DGLPHRRPERLRHVLRLHRLGSPWLLGRSRPTTDRIAPNVGGAVAAVSVYMLVFRLIHIAAGVTWAGSVFLLVVFVQPTAAAIAPAGGPFMTELLGKRRLVDRIIGMGSVTVVGGLFLYWHDWQA